MVLATTSAHQAPIEIVNPTSKRQVDQTFLIPIFFLNFELPFTILSFRVCFKNILSLQAPENKKGPKRTQNFSPELKFSLTISKP